MPGSPTVEANPRPGAEPEVKVEASPRLDAEPEAKVEATAIMAIPLTRAPPESEEVTHRPEKEPTTLAYIGFLSFFCT